MLVGSSVRRVALLGGLRIPFARSMGAYAAASTQEMLTATLTALVERYRLQGATLGDVGAGAVLKHSRDFGLTRECVLESGLARETPAFDLQRACGTSLDTAIVIGLKIAMGQISSGIAAGVDTASDVPMVYPDSYRRILLRSSRGRRPLLRCQPTCPSQAPRRLPLTARRLVPTSSCCSPTLWGDSRRTAGSTS